MDYPQNGTPNYDPQPNAQGQPYNGQYPGYGQQAPQPYGQPQGYSQPQYAQQPNYNQQYGQQYTQQPNYNQQYSQPQYTQQPNYNGQYGQPPYAQPPKKPRKKIPLWTKIAVPVAVVGVAAVCLWKPLSMKLAPKASLNRAMEQTTKAMEKRVNTTPIAAIGSAVDAIRSGTLTLDVTYDDGDNAVSGTLALSGDSEKNAYALDGAVTYQGQTIDASLYADGDCLAVGSDYLTDGTYYGITYDTFTEDLRSSFLSSYISEEDLQTITDLLDTLESLENSGGDKNILEPYEKVLKDYFKGLKYTSGSDTTEIGGTSTRCQTVYTKITVEDLVGLIQQLADMAENDEELYGMLEELVQQLGSLPDTDLGIDADDLRYEWQNLFSQLDYAISEITSYVDGSATLTYYILSDQVVKMELACDVSVSDGYETVPLTATASIDYGKDPSKGNYCLRLDMTVQGETMSVVADYTNDSGEAYFSDKLDISVFIPYESEMGVSISNNWNKNSGDLATTLAVREYGETQSITFNTNLKIDGDTFVFSIPDVYEFVNGFASDALYGVDHFNCAITLTGTKGGTVTKPQYVNLDQWTEERITELIQNIAGKLGMAASEDPAYIE